MSSRIVIPSLSLLWPTFNCSPQGAVEQQVRVQDPIKTPEKSSPTTFQDPIHLDISSYSLCVTLYHVHSPRVTSLTDQWDARMHTIRTSLLNSVRPVDVMKIIIFSCTLYFRCFRLLIAITLKAEPEGTLRLKVNLTGYWLVWQNSESHVASSVD